MCECVLAGLVAWDNNVLAGLVAWDSNVLAGLVAWDNNVPAGLVAWDNNVLAGLVAWDNNVPAGLVAWDNNVPAGLVAWDNNVLAGLVAWDNNVLAGLVAWDNNVPAGLVAWDNNVLDGPEPAGIRKNFIYDCNFLVPIGVVHSVPQVHFPVFVWCSDAITPGCTLLFPLSVVWRAHGWRSKLTFLTNRKSRDLLLMWLGSALNQISCVSTLLAPFPLPHLRRPSDHHAGGASTVSVCMCVCICVCTCVCVYMLRMHACLCVCVYVRVCVHDTSTWHFAHH